MRTILMLLASAGTAGAHTGHLGELAGHDHWVAGAAIAGAIALAAWQALKGARDDKEETEVEVEAAPEEVEA